MPRNQPTSPLSLVSDETDLHRFLARLAATRGRIEAGEEGIALDFTRTEVDAVAAAFSRSILRGEARLHRLCGLLAARMFRDHYGITSVVIGEIPGDPERFSLSHPISREVLFATTDLALGNRVLGNVRVRRDDAWLAPRLIANFVEYQPTDLGPWHVHKMTSRIKAEEEIWNKVVDELFDIDSLIRRDKELSQHSRYIKDVFGLKLVVSAIPDARRLHEALVAATFDPRELEAVGAPSEPSAREIVVFETKDYLDGYSKQSGWGAIKSVLMWWDAMFEVQIQPLENYYAEREQLTRESHAGFKQRREELRNRIARDVPTFGFMRDLLAWLFGASSDPPVHPGVQVSLDGAGR